MAEARTFKISEDDDGIRLDRWFKRNAPDISFNTVSRWARTGALRLDGKRATPGDRIEAGQTILFPAEDATPARAARPGPKREPLTPVRTGPRGPGAFLAGCASGRAAKRAWIAGKSARSGVLSRSAQSERGRRASSVSGARRLRCGELDRSCTLRGCC
jgi:hypothetical protein